MTVYTPAATGADEAWVVPAGVFSIAIDAAGAKGQDLPSVRVGGNGGRAQCTIATTPGETLTLRRALVQYPGGGNGNGNGSCKGGGYSGVFRGATPLCIAAGGGGAGGSTSSGWTSSGGAGGGTTGDTGGTQAASQNGNPGQGGTQSAGGNGGFGNNGNGSAGASLAGGAGAFNGNGVPTGGGGGGLYGGGGGGFGQNNAGGGGGGGSSYTTGTGQSTTTGYNNSTTGLLTLTYTVNQPPPAPVVTAPNGGENINNSVNVTWNAAVDPEGDAVVYDVDYSANNGGTWTNLITGTAATSYLWNTSALAQGATYLVRVRARDAYGQNSAYDQSNATFQILHNVAPTAATALTPDGGTVLDRALVQRLAWTFNDPNAGDTQSKVDWRWRLGVGAWTTATVVTPNPYVDVAGGTFPAGSIEWQVFTYDAIGTAGVWSASAFFTAATAPAAPAITAPANNSAQGAPTGVISWTTPNQDAYQVRKVADNAGAPNTAVIYYDTGTVVSTSVRNAALDFPVNNRTEHLQVRIRYGGLWSTWSTVKVNVAYSPPAVPVLSATPRPELAAIDVTVANPAPVNPQPAVASTELWRRVVGSGSAGERLKAAVVGGTYRDVTPASGVAYEYQAVAIGVTGTKQASAWTP